MLEEAAQADRMWPRQRARNMADCRAYVLEAMSWSGGSPERHASLRALKDLLEEGGQGEGFYGRLARLCRTCAEDAGERAGIFRIYAAIFEEDERGGSHDHA